jgi:hypothetical protein
MGVFIGIYKRGERESCPRVQPKHAKIRKKTKFEGAYMHDGE